MASRLVTLVVAFSACTHTDLARNAPGHISVLEAPVDPSTTAFEPPTDPGEQMLLIGFGAFAGGGFQAGAGRPTAGSYAVGPEVSVGYGWSRRSHNEDDPLIGRGVMPERAIDLNLGWTALSPLGRGVGPLYAEVEWRMNGLFGVAGGWTWDPEDRTHGPQATLNVGPLYARVTDELGVGAQVTFGLVLKGEDDLVWSR